jgi:hypothetical protein
MHWLGPFIIAEICESGAVILVQLNGILRPGLGEWCMPESLHTSSISQVLYPSWCREWPHR